MPWGPGSPYSLQGSLAGWSLSCFRCTKLFLISGPLPVLCPLAALFFHFIFQISA